MIDFITGLPGHIVAFVRGVGEFGAAYPLLTILLAVALVFGAWLAALVSSLRAHRRRDAARARDRRLPGSFPGSNWK